MMTQKGNPYLRLFSSLSAVRWCVAANYSLHKFSEGKMNDSGTAAVGCAGNSRIKSLWVPTLHMLIAECGENKTYANVTFKKKSNIISRPPEVKITFPCTSTLCTLRH